MTFQQIRNLTYQKISQVEGTSDFSASEINGFTNEGMRFLATLVKYPIDTVSVQVEEGKGAYTLPSDFLILKLAFFGDVSKVGDVLPLTIVSKESLTELFPSWLDETSGTKDRPNYVLLLDRQTVFIFPRPDITHSATGKKLIIDYVHSPATLSSDSQEPDLPIVYHDSLVDYNASKCYGGKLNRPDLAQVLFNTLVVKAKSLEPQVTAQIGRMQFQWGSADEPDDMLGDVIIP